MLCFQNLTRERRALNKFKIGFYVSLVLEIISFVFMCIMVAVNYVELAAHQDIYSAQKEAAFVYVIVFLPLLISLGIICYLCYKKSKKQ